MGAPIETGGEAVSPLPAATLFAILKDPRVWPAWSFIERFELEKTGYDDDPTGLGAIRRFRTGPVLAREQVVELTPDRRFGYVLLSGLPVKDYRANVDLTPVAGGTRIHWHCSFRPSLPGTGFAMKAFLRDVLQRSATALAALDEVNARSLLDTVDR
jgi:hypothetical protein